jgi:hypothetical protein
MKNVRNINRKERKRLNEKVEYWEGIAVKTRTEKNLEATAENLEIEELKNKICKSNLCAELLFFSFCWAI